MSARPFIEIGCRRAAFLSSVSMLGHDAARLTDSFCAPGALDDPRTRDDAAKTISEMRGVQRDLERRIGELMAALSSKGAAA